MSCARATTRDIRRWIAFSSVIVSLGCAGIKELSRPSPDNPLPPGVEKNEADFLRQIANFAPGDSLHERERKANGCFLIFCPKTRVQIVPLGDTHTIDPYKPPSSGRVVAQLVNLGNKTEKYYGLLPQAEADYYLWVDAKKATQAQWTLLQLSHRTHTVTAALPAELHYCHKYDYTVTKSNADFAKNRPEGKCDWPIPETKISRASLLPTRLNALLENVFAFLAFAAEGGGWISCSNGCCT